MNKNPLQKTANVRLTTCVMHSLVILCTLWDYYYYYYYYY